MEVSANRWHPLAFDAQSYGFRRTVARSPFWRTSVTASSPAPKGVSTRSHCKRVRKECGRTAALLAGGCGFLKKPVGRPTNYPHSIPTSQLPKVSTGVAMWRSMVCTRGLQAYPFQNSVCVFGMIHGSVRVCRAHTFQPAKYKRTFPRIF